MEMITIRAIDNDLTKRFNNVLTKFSSLKEQLDRFNGAVENLDGKKVTITSREDIDFKLCQNFHYWQNVVGEPPLEIFEKKIGDIT